MNDSTHVTRRPRRAWQPTARTVAAVIAMAVLIPLAACSASPSSTSSGTSSTGSSSSSNAGGAASSSLLAFSQCMRSKGVPNFPDPEAGAANAKFPTAQQLGVSSSQYQAAENACQHLLPAGTNDQFPAAEVPVLLAGMRQFSQCMRSHGVSNWPDPTTDSEGHPVFDLGDHGITRSEANSPPITTTEQACRHLMPRAIGGGQGIPIGG